MALCQVRYHDRSLGFLFPLQRLCTGIGAIPVVDVVLEVSRLRRDGSQVGSKRHIER